jgi:predicted nucleic acid-binding protein
VTAFLDTNVIVRHLTADPPAAGARATAYLERADALLLTDVIAAEVVFVLESFYEVPRPRVAELMRSVLAFEPIRALDPDLLWRALEVYEVDRLDFAEAYLVACAESSGVGVIASFDRSLDRVRSVNRIAS